MVAGKPADPLAEALLAWYAAAGRHALPWRHTRDPYALWLAEIMLQQTQVATVIPYYERFLARFPRVEDLAAATPDEVLHLWSGLGYYSRARNLHAAARLIVQDFQGRFPRALDALTALPGIGRSTAGAILSSAFDASHPILDGNVKRVLCRYHAFAGDPASAEGQRLLWDWAAAHTPAPGAHLYNQAIQDLGATVCRRRQPQCLLCPLQSRCQAFAQGLSEALPRPRVRRILPVRQAWLGIIRNPEGRVLLQRQGPSGLWGGLWILPQMPRRPDSPPEAAAEGFSEQMGTPLSVVSTWPAGRHSFSHFHLDYVPVELLCRQPQAREAGALQWIDPRAPGVRGLAKPTERILRLLAPPAEPGD